MGWIPGGISLMGSNHHPEEAPVHQGSVEDFWMDKYAATNEQFASLSTPPRCQRLPPGEARNAAARIGRLSEGLSARGPG
jgi:formylglycine-generating enzyme required for sulfatase activity